MCLVQQTPTEQLHATNSAQIQQGPAGNVQQGFRDILGHHFEGGKVSGIEV